MQMKLSTTLSAYASTIKIICLVAFSLLSAYAGHYVTNNHWSAKWQQRDLADSTALIAANAAEREKELSWSAKIEKVSEDAKLEQAKITADAAELSATVSELRHTIKVSDSNLQSTNTSIARLRAANATTKLVHAELSGWCVSRIEVMAGIIDRIQSAGLACQKSYNAIRMN